VIAEYKLGAGPHATAQSTRRILMQPQPARIHNMGDMWFGPDGMLWIGWGDGGPEGDPFNRAQNLTTMLGKVRRQQAHLLVGSFTDDCVWMRLQIVRVDVDHPAQGLQYGIPSDNPYAQGQQGYLPEIWASGYRNPWRCAYDPLRPTVALCGDVVRSRHT
jgi:glucose/arabinose dehydrogenase